MDAYIQRFEYYATASKWDAGLWSFYLSTLLTGRALSVFSNLLSEDIYTTNFANLKQTLLTQYDHTEDDYLIKLRVANPQEDETPLRESGLSDLDSLASRTDEYFQARGSKLSLEQNDVDTLFQPPLNDEGKGITSQDESQQFYSKTCGDCGERGHDHETSSSSRNGDGNLKQKYGRNYNHDKTWNLRCQNLSEIKSAATQFTTHPQDKVTASCCLINEEVDDVRNFIHDGKITVEGKSIPVISLSCRQISKDDNQMPIAHGKVNGQRVNVLRDTGCSGLIVKRNFVNEEQLTGNFKKMLLIDNTLRIAPEAHIFTETPFYTGEVEALCLDDALYDLKIGNIEGTLGPEVI